MDLQISDVSQSSEFSQLAKRAAAVVPCYCCYCYYLCISIAGNHMAPSVGDGAQWDGSCCALKLIKLAAGDFDSEHVLGSNHPAEQPSWTIAGSSPTASESNHSANGIFSADTNRSVRGMTRGNARPG